MFDEQHSASTGDRSAAGSDRLADLEGRITDLETRLDALIRIVATIRPLETMLESFGATKAQEKALLGLLDEMSTRVGDPRHPPSCSYFLDRLYAIFPEHRTNRHFVEVLVGSLVVERAAYRKLREYMTKECWPVVSATNPPGV